ncbi:hypothetical protein JG687_00019724, partial [Phytophthora cactorum]
MARAARRCILAVSPHRLAEGEGLGAGRSCSRGEGNGRRASWSRRKVPSCGRAPEAVVRTQWKERDILSVCQTGIEVVQVKKSRLESTAENLLVRMEEKAKLTPLLDASQ